MHSETNLFKTLDDSKDSEEWRALYLQGTRSKLLVCLRIVTIRAASNARVGNYFGWKAA